MWHYNGYPLGEGSRTCYAIIYHAWFPPFWENFVSWLFLWKEFWSSCPFHRDRSVGDSGGHRELSAAPWLPSRATTICSLGPSITADFRRCLSITSGFYCMEWWLVPEGTASGTSHPCQFPSTSNMSWPLCVMAHYTPLFPPCQPIAIGRSASACMWPLQHLWQPTERWLYPSFYIHHNYTSRLLSAMLVKFATASKY